MLRPKLVITASPAPSALSPERQALAEAIEDLRQRSAELAAVETAIGRARGAMYDQRHAVDEAEADIERAKVDVADHLAAVALGTAGSPPRTIRQARQKRADAEDDLQAALSAVAALEGRLADAKQAAGFAADRVTRTAAAVLQGAPEVAATLVAAEAAIRELVRVGTAVLWLERQRVVTPHIGSRTFAMFVRLRDAMEPLCRTTSVVTEPDLRNDPSLDGGQVWAAAMAALLKDATAPLPAGA